MLPFWKQSGKCGDRRKPSMKTKQTEFVRKLKAIKRWLELKGVIEQLGITKEIGRAHV